MTRRASYCISDHVLTPLGDGSKQNYDAARAGQTGIRLISDKQLHPTPTLCAKFTSETLGQLETEFDDSLTLLENLMCYSIKQAIEKSPGIDLSKTGLFISTTKGNIDILDKQHPKAPFDESRVALDTLGTAIGKKIGIEQKPIVVSNACISGVSALLTAQRFIEMSEIDHAIVCGGDLISPFIVSGFHAFLAISDEPCAPYDKDRKGITLGDGVATVILSTSKTEHTELGKVVRIAGGGSANDANHISGPSRTGEGLFISIEKALKTGEVSASDVDMISAHGTATPYNDEMESVAFTRANLQDAPLNSLKGYFGHTLGAAGLVESILGLHQLANKEIIATKGLQQMGVSNPIHAVNEATRLNRGNHLLKTISGFGGFNAAVLFKISSE